MRKISASPFTLAVKLGLLSMNPLVGLPPLKSTRIEKGVFTGEEISKTHLRSFPGLARGYLGGLLHRGEIKGCL